MVHCHEHHECDGHGTAVLASHAIRRSSSTRVSQSQIHGQKRRMLSPKTRHTANLTVNLAFTLTSGAAVKGRHVESSARPNIHVRITPSRLGTDYYEWRDALDAFLSSLRSCGCRSLDSQAWMLACFHRLICSCFHADDSPCGCTVCTGICVCMHEYKHVFAQLLCLKILCRVSMKLDSRSRFIRANPLFESQSQIHGQKTPQFLGS